MNDFILPTQTEYYNPTAREYFGLFALIFNFIVALFFSILLFVNKTYLVSDVIPILIPSFAVVFLYSKTHFHQLVIAPEYVMTKWIKSSDPIYFDDISEIKDFKIYQRNGRSPDAISFIDILLKNEQTFSINLKGLSYTNAMRVMRIFQHYTQSETHLALENITELKKPIYIDKN